MYTGSLLRMWTECKEHKITEEKQEENIAKLK
jgi:hypothetical protein